MIDEEVFYSYLFIYLFILEESSFTSVLRGREGKDVCVFLY